ncbi:MAG: hypothetical protein HY820_04165 [Acidobacteria bacterium]|nr:hypothetical protein [Acidobacteriota bacterium]
MDLCLQCGLPIPPQVALLGESRFCCPQHRSEFRLTQERVRLLQIPEPGAEWELPPEAYGDSTLMAPLLAEACPALRIHLRPRTPQSQPVSRKYAIEFQCQSSLPPLGLARSVRLASLRPRVAPGCWFAPVPVVPQPGRQDRLSRYSLVMSLMRLNQELQPVRSSTFYRSHPVQISKQPAPVYRKLRGFPVFTVAEGEPALSGFAVMGAAAWACTQPLHVRAGSPPQNVSSALDAVLPNTAIAAAGSVPSASYTAIPMPALDAAVGRLHGFDVFPVNHKPASPRHIPSLREPWDLSTDFVPSLDSVRDIADSLLATRFQLRDRRSEFGLHVPQAVMLPLRPRLLLSTTEASVAPTTSEREAGVVSILSLRAALGSRR